MKHFVLTPSRRALGKALGCATHQSFAKHAVSNVIIRSYIIKHLGRIIKMELKSLCSSSILLNKDKEVLSTFNWERLTHDFKMKSPLLYALLESCLPKFISLDSEAIVGSCICILAKSRRYSASLLQRIVSLVLYQGHAGKQVSMHAYMI